MGFAKARIRPVVDRLTLDEYIMKRIGIARGSEYTPAMFAECYGRKPNMHSGLVFPDNGKGSTTTWARRSRGLKGRKTLPPEPEQKYNERVEAPPTQKVGWLGKVKGLFRRKGIR